jgi:uncharacterized heparinase superfamily protein
MGQPLRRAAVLLLSLPLYIRTIRFLRAGQIFGRARFRLYRPTPDTRAAPAMRARGRWIAAVERPRTLLGPRRFWFLNIERELQSEADWNHPEWQKLWLYNLHYFDDLNSKGAASRAEWHRALVAAWIEQNAPGSGSGWEPYTLSLRIVNWVKWALAGNQLSDSAVQSLAVQARYLAGRMEFHLLGNHLWANAKALVFVGLFFEGEESSKWMSRGLAIIDEQLREQVLADGGHFERSPMYHNIILEDLLDLINVFEVFEFPGREAAAAHAREYAPRMLEWARAMAHPDGEIALLNDSALGIAPTVATLEAYAQRLDLYWTPRSDDVVHMQATGYLRVRSGDACAILDVGRIGPDYLPGHAHADTLSFELSLRNRRILVDSGTSTYEPGPERLRQRSTHAHNTVEIDGVSSSEVWGSFRVARRAYPRGLEMLQSNDMIRVRCAHDGYTRLKGRPIHLRNWEISTSGMVISDTIEGDFGRAVARYRFHPECVLSPSDGRSGSVEIAGERALSWSVEQGRAAITDSTYHPEFGLSLPTKCLEVELGRGGARIRFGWSL